MAMGLTQPLTEMSSRNIFPGRKGGRCLGLTTLPPSCADCLEIWEPQLPGNLRACPGLQCVFGCSYPVVTTSQDIGIPQNRTRDLPKDSTHYGPKYNSQHSARILSQHRTLQDKNSHSQSDIHKRNINRGY